MTGLLREVITRKKKAAQLTKIIVGVIEACHSLGVMHRDLKPENFLFVNEEEDSPLKAIDFGLSVFFKPGMFWVPFLLYKYFISLGLLLWLNSPITTFLISLVPPFPNFLLRYDNSLHIC